MAPTLPSPPDISPHIKSTPDGWTVQLPPALSPQAQRLVFAGSFLVSLSVMSALMWPFTETFSTVFGLLCGWIPMFFAIMLVGEGCRHLLSRTLHITPQAVTLNGKLLTAHELSAASYETVTKEFVRTDSKGRRLGTETESTQRLTLGGDARFVNLSEAEVQWLVRVFAQVSGKAGSA